ncbi:MAG: RNA polymerase sigma factor RpoD/SigA [bacterium]|nr:RNA polymerase sigma factor RpoD/SigA [bacterium]
MKQSSFGTDAGDSLRYYMKEVSTSQPLSSKEEGALARQIRSGSREARDKLVQANLKFVVRVAREYRGRGVFLPDLISAGNLGLVMAAERFDEARGTRFITYAVWWIRQAILQTLSDHSRTVRLPSNRVELLQKVSWCMKRRQQENPDVLPVREVAEELELTEEQVRDALASGQPTVSLNSGLNNGEEGSLMDTVVDEKQASPESLLFQDSMKRDIASVLESLEEREKEVIRLYFGLDEAKKEMTLEAIGKDFGLTRERVRQIKERALNKMRHPMQGRKLLAYAEGF